MTLPALADEGDEEGTGWADHDEAKAGLKAFLHDQIWDGVKDIRFDASEYRSPDNEDGVTESEVKLICASLYDEPDLFALNRNSGISPRHEGDAYQVTPPYLPQFVPETGTPTAAYADAKETYAATLDSILSEIDEDWPEVLKVFRCHDILATRYSHHYTSDGETAGSNQDVYTMMDTGMGAPEAYTYFFMALMRRLDIPCSYVSSAALGTGSRSHRWNVVKIGEYWYHVDVYMDDYHPVTSVGQVDVPGYVRHEYCIISTAQMKLVGDGGHFRADDWRYADSSVTCRATTYDGYIWSASVSPMVPLKGSWYFLDRTSLRVWDGRTASSTVQETLADLYEAVGGPPTNTPTNYSGLFAFGGKLYFNTNHYILRYDPTAREVEMLLDNLAQHAGSTLQGCARDTTSYGTRLMYARLANYMSNTDHLDFDPYVSVEGGDYSWYAEDGVLYLQVLYGAPVTVAYFDEDGRMLRAIVRSTEGPAVLSGEGVSFKLFRMGAGAMPVCGAVADIW